MIKNLAEFAFSGWKIKSPEDEWDFNIKAIFLIEIRSRGFGMQSYHPEIDYNRRALCLTLRFGFDGYGFRTFQEVGKILGVTPTRARQITCQTARMLRHRDRYKHLIGHFHPRTPGSPPLQLFDWDKYI